MSMENIVARFSPALRAAALKLAADKPVWYVGEVVAMREAIDEYITENKGSALRVLHVIAKNEERRGTKIKSNDGKLLVNWSGWGYGYNAGHRALAEELYAKYKHLPPVEAIKLLTPEQQSQVVDVAKRYTKQIVLDFILKTKV